jgi:hypothetical protein
MRSFSKDLQKPVEFNPLVQNALLHTFKLGVRIIVGFPASQSHKPQPAIPSDG